MNPFVKISLLALGPALGLGIARFAYGLLLPPMKADLGISYAQAGFPIQPPPSEPSPWRSALVRHSARWSLAT
jgi:hypothetical protein